MVNSAGIRTTCLRAEHLGRGGISLFSLSFAALLQEAGYLKKDGSDG